MAFLVWDNQQDAEDSLDAINSMYGLPFEAENGYRMDRWDIIKESNTAIDYGFFKPEERLGMEMDDLMPALMPGFTEHEEVPEDFIPEEVEEEPILFLSIQPVPAKAIGSTKVGSVKVK